MQYFSVIVKESKRVFIGPVFYRKYGVKCYLHIENPVFVYPAVGYIYYTI